MTSTGSGGNQPSLAYNSFETGTCFKTSGGDGDWLQLQFQKAAVATVKVLNLPDTGKNWTEYLSTVNKHSELAHLDVFVVHPSV